VNQYQIRSKKNASTILDAPTERPDFFGRYSAAATAIAPYEFLPPKPAANAVFLADGDRPTLSRMDLSMHENELRDQFQERQIQFLLTEVEVATTFCNVAKSSDNAEKIKRNLANAWEGYTTILRFAPRAHFDVNSESEFVTKFARLKCLLRELGKDV
jgi:hypothetical protein